MANKTATLTHKVRNPQNLDSWLDIWSADVSADFDENNNRTKETVVITPSSNWEIPADKLTGTVPVTQISNVTSPTIEDPTKTETQKNVSIIEPEGNHIAITNENGSISEGAKLPANDADGQHFLNDKGEWAEIAFTVDLEKIEENDQEIVTSNAQFKVGNDTVTIRPQGKLSFKEVANNGTEIKLSLGKIETGDIEDHTIILDNLDLTTLNDPNNPNSGKKFKLPAENIENIPVTQITNFNTAVNDAVSTNTINNAGIVAAGIDHTSEAWLTDSKQNPGWAKVTVDHMANELELDKKLKENSISGNKLNTKLLGVWIDDVPPSYNENIGDLYTSSNLNSNDLNEWDYEHCGIWVQI